jgi:hypothetical protein
LMMSFPLLHWCCFKAAFAILPTLLNVLQHLSFLWLNEILEDEFEFKSCGAAVLMRLCWAPLKLSPEPGGLRRGQSYRVTKKSRFLKVSADCIFEKVAE